jgi:hypothetical protein
MFNGLKNLVGSGTGAISSGATKGVEETMKKELCALMQQDKDEITGIVVKAIKDKIAEDKSIIQPIIDIIKNAVNSEISEPAASSGSDVAASSDKDTSAPSGTNMTVPLATGAAVLAAPAIAVAAAPSVEKAAESVAGEAAKVSDALPVGMPSLPAGMPSLPAGMPSLPAGMPSLPAGMPSLPKGIPALPAGIPAVPKDASSLLAGASMLKSFMGGNTRRKYKKRRHSKTMKPRYGPRCKTLFYKNGGRRKKSRSSCK